MRNLTTTTRSVLAVVLVAAVTLAVVVWRGTYAEPAAAPAGVLSGTVVDERDRPVAGASVLLPSGDEVLTDDAGRFRTGAAHRGGHLVTVRADGHLPRTQAAETGVPIEVVLTGDAAATVSLRFGGDVMFGRRYFDRDEDGDRSDGVLAPGASAAEHAALLEHVQPLLEDADLTVVNFETPVIEDPYIDPTTPRRPDLHPTKEYVFASADESVDALLDVGVDLVSLGNNHVLDALGGGLETTIEILDRAGLPHFGAGSTIDAAWAPAFVERKGQRFAFLACTTITGTEHEIPYIATAEQGGAAQCATSRLAQEVRDARAQADTVVVMMHGGEEYEAEQTDLVRRLTTTATETGAALVVNGHPHVVGGVTVEDGALVAETTGNLLFDQTVWPTFLSYLLRVDVREGEPVVATTDPLLLEGEVPRPTVGVVADAAARRAAGLLPGPVRLRGPGAAYLEGQGADEGGAEQVLALEAGEVTRLPTSTWVDAPVRAQLPVRLGEDLLWTGSFEDMDADPATSGSHHWAYGDNVRRTADAACGQGSGMELLRSPVSTRDVILTPTHRQLVEAGSSLSLVADVRGASEGATLELALFGDTKGPSLATERVVVPSGDRGPDDCRRVRLDVAVPPGVVAAQPFIRLEAPGGAQRGAHLRVDDVMLVAWAPDGASGRRFGVVEASEDVRLPLRSDRRG